MDTEEKLGFNVQIQIHKQDDKDNLFDVDSSQGNEILKKLMAVIKEYGYSSNAVINTIYVRPNKKNDKS